MDWLKALWDAIVTNWEWIIAVALPFGVALVAKTTWTASMKGWLAVGMSLALGVVATFVQGLALTPETIVPFFLAMIGATQLAYRVFRSFGITSAWLDRLLGIGSSG